MVQIIKQALESLDLTAWSIRSTRKETREAFFVRKHLDLQRSTKTEDYEVTVYLSYPGPNGEKLLGSSTVSVFPGMTLEEILPVLQAAKERTHLAGNPYYELFQGPQETAHSRSAFAQMSQADWILDTAKAVFAPDVSSEVFVNSLEIFGDFATHHVLTSAGTDVTWDTCQVHGEYVIQCLVPADVETYHSFDLRQPDWDGLRREVEDALVQTQDRAKASEPPKAGKYTVVLSEGNVYSLLRYYLARSSSFMVYQQYSDWAVGQNVQGDAGLQGDAVSIRFAAPDPYDAEGIPLQPQPLLEQGVLKTIHGNARFAWYLHIPPTGQFQAIEVPLGSKSMEEMLHNPCLHVVTFSDFQMNPLTGHFGGEIRLAYLSDGNTIRPVTGGSVNGNILEAQKDMVFSSDRFQSAVYDGPRAVALGGVNVAGLS